MSRVPATKAPKAPNEDRIMECAAEIVGEKPTEIMAKLVELDDYVADRLFSIAVAAFDAMVALDDEPEAILNDIGEWSKARGGPGAAKITAKIEAEIEAES